MRRHRTIARGALFLFLVAGLLAGTAAARSGGTTKPIVFPVLGAARYTDDFGDPRPGGPHQGIDMVAAKKSLALAAEAGKVKFWTTSATAGCMLYLYGASGTTYYYIHLNNDVTNGNDNRGGCKVGITFAKGLKSGARVKAGQPIGFVGDSGDANGIHPHLHFEVHPHGGRSTDPYQRLLAARRMLFYVAPGSTFTLSMSATVIATSDESLRVRVNTLRASPGNMVLRRLDRPLVLTVPTYASIERGQAGNVAQLADAKRGERIAVWTEAATVTAAASEGRAGAISAERIVLPSA